MGRQPCVSQPVEICDCHAPPSSHVDMLIEAPATFGGFGSDIGSNQCKKKLDGMNFVNRHV